MRPGPVVVGACSHSRAFLSNLSIHRQRDLSPAVCRVGSGPVSVGATKSHGNLNRTQQNENKSCDSDTFVTSLDLDVIILYKEEAGRDYPRGLLGLLVYDYMLKRVVQTTRHHKTGDGAGMPRSFSARACHSDEGMETGRREDIDVGAGASVIWLQGLGAHLLRRALPSLQGSGRTMRTEIQQESPVVWALKAAALL